MNNRRIGFDRELKLNWLDLTAGLVLEGLDIQQLRQELLARLSAEISGDKACKNTVSVLTRIWARVPPEHQSLRAEVLTLLPHVSPPDRLWLHWGMSLLAYPFFHDVAAIVGRLLGLQGEFASTQVLRRMQESWGQRTTLERAVRRLLQTFVAWGVTRELPSARHVYQAAPPRQTTNSTLALWLIECVLRSTLAGRGALGAHTAREAMAQDNGQLPLAELIQSPAAFPFDLRTHAADIRRCDRFEISRQGLDLEMIAPHVK
jgi:hypothetical protein